MAAEHEQRMLDNPLLRASMDNALDLAADLNKKKQGSEDGLYSNKSYDQISE